MENMDLHTTQGPGVQKEWKKEQQILCFYFYFVRKKNEQTGVRRAIGCLSSLMIRGKNILAFLKQKMNIKSCTGEHMQHERFEICHICSPNMKMEHLFVFNFKLMFYQQYTANIAPSSRNCFTKMQVFTRSSHIMYVPSLIFKFQIHHIFPVRCCNLSHMWHIAAKM